MTVTNQKREIKYIGDGITTVWTYDFVILAAGDVLVVVINDSTSIREVIDAEDYTIAGLGEEAGGTVTYPKAGTPLSTTQSIVIQRNTVKTQEITVSNQTAYDAGVVEKVWDKGILIDQDNMGNDSTDISFPVGDDACPTLPGVEERKDKCFCFDENGEIVMAEIEGGGGVVVDDDLSDDVTDSSLVGGGVTTQRHELFPWLPPENYGVWPFGHANFVSETANTTNMNQMISDGVPMIQFNGTDYEFNDGLLVNKFVRISGRGDSGNGTTLFFSNFTNQRGGLDITHSGGAGQLGPVIENLDLSYGGTGAGDGGGGLRRFR